MKEWLIRWTPNFLFVPLANRYYRWFKNSRIKIGKCHCIFTCWKVTKDEITLTTPTPKFLGLHSLTSFASKFERFFRIEKGDVCVDVGACIGDTTVPMIMKTGSEGFVYAIEPEPLNLAFLDSNTMKFDNVKIIGKAVWKCKTTLSFNLHGTPTGHSLVKLDNHYDSVVQVEADTLDNLLETHACIDFLKVDVQGAELEALQGAEETLKKTSKLVVETHGFGRNALYAQVARVLRKRGFKVNVTQNRMVHGLRLKNES